MELYEVLLETTIDFGLDLSLQAMLATGKIMKNRAVTVRGIFFHMCDLWC